MLSKIFYELKQTFNDIKKLENKKTLYSDKETDLNNLNDSLLIFMINKH